MSARPGRASLALVGAFAVAIGCGGDPATDAPSPVTPAAPGAVADAYELDVIAEAEPDEGPPPLQVQFHGYVEEEAGGPWRFQWDLGDGATSTEQNPVHTYEREGDYTAVLTVTDQRGNTGGDEIDVFVETDD